jgi:hypothetical protein
MNYLRSFLNEQGRTKKGRAPTDRTDKSASVSFVSDSSAHFGAALLPKRNLEAESRGMCNSSERTESSEGAAAIIEATFKPTVDPVLRQVNVAPANPQFPPCPKCGATRYWISREKVMCGSKSCYSAVRFILTSIEFHPVH